MHIWLSQSLDISKFNCLHISSWTWQWFFNHNHFDELLLFTMLRNFRVPEVSILRSWTRPNLESPHSMNRYFKKVKYFFGFIFNFFCGGQFFQKNRRKPALFILNFLGGFCAARGKHGQKSQSDSPKPDSKPIRMTAFKKTATPNIYF